MFEMLVIAGLIAIVAISGLAIWQAWQDPKFYLRLFKYGLAFLTPSIVKYFGPASPEWYKEIDKGPGRSVNGKTHKDPTNKFGREREH